MDGISYDTGMQNLFRLLRGEGESYGLSMDGAEVGAVRIQRLSGGRARIESAPKMPANFWLTTRKDFRFVIRHSRIPPDFRGSLQNFVQADAHDKFPMKDDKVFIRTDGILDPDGVVFVHGIAEPRYRDILKDFTSAGIGYGKAAGLVPPAVALHRAVELLEQRQAPRFLVILHFGKTGTDFVGVRGGRPVFHRSVGWAPFNTGKSDQAMKLAGAVQRQPSISAVDAEKWRLAFLRQITGTAQYLEKKPHFGVPEEVVLTGPRANDPGRLDEIRAVFSKSQVRRLAVSNKILSESMSEEEIRSNSLAIGAAAMGLRRNDARKIDFLADPKIGSMTSPESVYDKIILCSAAAMLALAFVTGNALLLDLKKSRLETAAENQKTLNSLRSDLQRLRPELEDAERLLNAAAIRLDSYKSKTFSMPVSISKLLAAVEAATPAGVTLDKIEAGPGPGAGGAPYTNFFSQGEPVSVAISGRAELPEHVIEFQDSLREALGVSVDIVTMGREGADPWAPKPLNFVIALRGPLSRA